MLEFSDLDSVVPITRDHDRKSFHSGVKSLDNYLRDRSIGDVEKHLSSVFVLPLKKHPETIIGYYSLSSLTVPIETLPEETRKNLPSYKVIGTTLMGKLAVDEKWQRDKCKLKIGEHLLIHAMHTAWTTAQKVASFAIVVRVHIGEKGDPTPFYRKFKFMQYSDDPLNMFLPMATIEQMLREAGIIN